MKAADINIRDPFILLENDTYYMYGTRANNYGVMTGGFDVYVSADLSCWSDPIPCFDSEKYGLNKGPNWAPEVHKYQGRFYMLASFSADNERLGTFVLQSDSPLDPFVPLTGEEVTPKHQSCIDGSFTVQDGIPYLLYSHDWPDNYVTEEEAYVGEICAARLSEDLTTIVGEPWVLFASTDSPISKASPEPLVHKNQHCLRYGSDGPFVKQLSDGSLFLTWSPYLKDHYVVLGLISPNGRLQGPWTHLPEPLFDQDGGHSMMFDTREGGRCLCLHSPERKLQERPHLFALEEKNGTLRVVKELNAEGAL